MFFHELWLVWTTSAHFTGCVWYAQNTHPTPGTVRTWAVPAARTERHWAEHFVFAYVFFLVYLRHVFFKPILYISVLPNFTLALVWATFFGSVSPNFSCQWPSFVILQLLAHALRVPLNRWLWDGGHSISCQWEGGQAGVVSWSPNTKQLQNHCGKKWINVLNLPSGK